MACNVVTVYFNRDTYDIVGEPGKREWIEDWFERYFEDKEAFSEWLYDRYYAVELFNMTEEDKERVLEEYRESLGNQADEAFEREFDIYEVEIE